MTTIVAQTTNGNKAPLRSRHEELAKLWNIDPRTAMNQIHGRRFPIPVWKDGAGYFAHFGDVARWLDAKREQAARESQDA
jgi:hypothetical protein